MNQQQEEAASGNPDMFRQLGSITRQLHDALKELGYTDKLKGTVDQLPDAQSRLSYIARLTDIMMAQDFHDLTGQVIGRVVQLAGTIEEQLLSLLLQSAPGGQPGQDHAIVDQPALAGPVVNAEGRTDVVSDQAQVDDLLASLGF